MLIRDKKNLPIIHNKITNAHSSHTSALNTFCCFCNCRSLDEMKKNIVDLAYRVKKLEQVDFAVSQPKSTVKCLQLNYIICNSVIIPNLTLL